MSLYVIGRTESFNNVDVNIATSILRRKYNKADVAAFDILVIQKQAANDEWGMADLKPYVSNCSSVRDLIVFALYGDIATLWGFANVHTILTKLSAYVNNMHNNPHLSRQTLATLVKSDVHHNPRIPFNRSLCSTHCPSYIYYGLHPMPPHSSYTGYASPPRTVNEMDLVSLHYAVAARFSMYHGHFEQVENDQVYLQTRRDVVADYAAYSLILSVLRDPSYRYHYRFDMGMIRDKWLEGEMYIMKQRSVGMSLERALQLVPELKASIEDTTQYDAEGKVDITETSKFRRMLYLDPCCTLFAVLPFEEIPALVAKRQVALHHGNAYVGEKHTEEFINGVLQRRHILTWTKNERRFPLQLLKQPNMARLVKYIQTQFALMMGGGFEVEQLPRLLRNSNEIAMFAPRCIQKLHGIHLKYEERGIYSRFLFDCQWTADEVYALWQKAFPANKLTSDVKAKLKFDYEKSKINKRAAPPKMSSRSCRGMCEGGFCGFNGNRDGCVQDFVKRWNKLRPGQPLPKEGFHSPYTFTKLLAW